MRVSNALSILLVAFLLTACKPGAEFFSKQGPDSDLEESTQSGDFSTESGGDGDGEDGAIDNTSGDGSDDGGTLGGLVTDTFQQTNYTERYDFLWVIDNSGSMSNIHDYMSQKLNDFVTVLESRQSLDWQMAVTITDHVHANGNLVEGTNGVRVVNKDSVNPSGEWASIINNIGGTPYSGWEQGLESGRAAFENYGSEFSRANTPLVVTYISDEEDYSCQDNCNGFNGLPENQTGWNAFPTSRYVDHWADVAQNNNANVISYSIVHLQPLGLPGSCDDNYGFQGTRYMDVISAMGTGDSLSLCQSDMDASFDRVAQLTANLGVCFTLNNPVSTTNGMIVEVDGSQVNESATDGYQYEAADNQVCFNGSYIPANGSTVSVTYMTQ